MKRVFGILAALVIVVGVAGTANANTLITTQTFCNVSTTTNSCPGGLIASLTLEMVDDATNTYQMSLRLDTSDASFPSSLDFIQSVEFAIEGVNGDNVAPWGTYETVPTLSTAPGGTGSWNAPLFDKVNQGNSNNCVANQNNSASVCTAAAASFNSGWGAPTGGDAIWVFDLNLDDGAANLTSAVNLNLRAVFLGANGTNGTILSPEFTEIPDTSTPSGNDTPGTPGTTPTTPGSGGDTSVPEPTSLILLGSGLAYVSTRLRRRAE